MRKLGALSALVVSLGCQHATTPAASSSQRAPAGAAVELRTLDDRPALGLVLREGDPKGALALAVAHDFGSEASLGLSALVASRLEGAGFKAVSARPHALGFVVSTLVTTPAEAGRFVQAAALALKSPVQEPARARPQGRTPPLRGPADAAVHACSGELGLPGGGGGSTPVEPADARALERWRTQLQGARFVAFSAVGTRALLDALAAAVSATDRWTNDAEPSDAWPEADSIGSTGSGERRLSVAYRVADGARALEVAQTLATPGSVLATRLSALDGTFRLDRVVASTRVRGACLRVDVRAPSAETALMEVARAVSVVDEEARTPMEARSGSPSSLDDAVLRPTHPADAAAAAAWRVLTARQPAGPTRRAVSWLGPVGTDTSGKQLERALAGLEAARHKSTLERRVRLESGQGELWVLLASPCGTASESSDDAGIHELLSRALAQKRNGLLGVQIDPWVTPDAVGLLAHSPRAGATESPSDHARRVGDALGRALVATRLTGSDVAELKTALLSEIGPAGQRGYWAALDGVSGGHPSWLDPRGTWRAVSSTLTPSADSRRRVLISGPLRLAVLANSAGDQAEAAAASVERWLRPFRAEPTACAAGGRVGAPGGEIAVEVSRPEHARAYLAYPFASGTGGPPREAEWTAHLLNRPGGWLEQALRGVGEAHARAAVLGGKNAAALLIEIQCAESERAAAVSQIRSLGQRLAKGEASEADAELARRHFDARDAERALDPRGRVVDLWRGSPPPRADIASLRRFQQALGAAKEIVVHAKTAE